MSTECYMCENVAVSVEHIPAKCFFPANKRKNLLTVPSCKEHNEDTTLDDEYIRNIISMAKGNNQVAVDLFKDKGIRSLGKSPRLSKLIAKNPGIMNWVKDDDRTKTMTYAIDRNRFDKTMRKIAYGLYFHTFKRRWNCFLQISTRHFVKENNEPDDISPILYGHVLLQETIKTYGNNPDVFQYGFLNFQKSDRQILLIKFYEFFEVWVIPGQVIE